MTCFLFFRTPCVSSSACPSSFRPNKLSCDNTHDISKNQSSCQKCELVFNRFFSVLCTVFIASISVHANLASSPSSPNPTNTSFDP